MTNTFLLSYSFEEIQYFPRKREKTVLGSHDHFERSWACDDKNEYNIFVGNKVRYIIPVNN